MFWNKLQKNATSLPLFLMLILMLGKGIMLKASPMHQPTINPCPFFPSCYLFASALGSYTPKKKVIQNHQPHFWNQESTEKSLTASSSLSMTLVSYFSIIPLDAPISKCIVSCLAFIMCLWLVRHCFSYK